VSWPLAKFKDVAQIVTGSTPKKVDGNYNGTVPFVTPGDLGSNALISNAKVTVTEKGAKSGRLLPKGTVMVCCIGATIGKVGIAERDVISNQQINSLIFDELQVYPKYGYYFCLTIKPLLLNRSSSTTMPIVNKSNFSEFEIPLPPLDEQKRIAAILDKADAIRRKRQQAIQLADDFLRSVFLDMFGDPVTWNKNDIAKGWTVKPIEEISLLKRGYDLPKQSRLEGNIPIYAANGITGTHNEFKVKGPGVITGRSGTIGKVIYSENDFWPLNTALYVTNFYGNNPKYIEWYLRFLNLERYVQGAGVPTLNRNLFLKEVSAVPPKAEQDRFEVICKLVSQLIFKNLDFNKKELFNSLSQKAFAGEL
tara:strand:+ start:135 stop:1229 length:1095 start_codon:yes stop_codon:yes gene_type:complete